MAEVKNAGRSPVTTNIPSTSEEPEATPVQQGPIGEELAENMDRTVDALKKQSTESKSLQDLQGKMHSFALDDKLNKKQSQYPTGLQYQTGAPPITNSQGQVITAKQAQIDELATAAQAGDIVKLRKLIAAGVDVNGKDSVSGFTPLMEAAKAGHTHIIDELMGHGAKIDEKGNNGQTALIHAATVDGNESILHHLIHKYHANVNAQDNTGRSALMMTAIRNQPKMMKELLDANASTNILDGKPGIDPEPGQNALMYAAERGNKECIELLIKAGVDVDMPSRKGKTALYLAAARGQAETVERLIQENANPNVPDREQRTPLMIAAWGGWNQVVKTLVAKHAALDERDDGGYTAVFHAATNGKHDALKALMDAHANPDIPLNLPGITKNWTPIMEAAREGDLKSVEILLQGGAQKKLVNGDGKTALMVAQQALTRTDLTDDEKKNIEAVIKLLQ